MEKRQGEFSPVQRRKKTFPLTQLCYRSFTRETCLFYIRTCVFGHGLIKRMRNYRQTQHFINDNSANNVNSLFLDIALLYLIAFQPLCGSYATLAHVTRLSANFSGGAQNLTVPEGCHSCGPGVTVGAINGLKAVPGGGDKGREGKGI